MKNRDVDELRRARPSRSRPSAEMLNGVIVISGLVFTETQKSIGGPGLGRERNKMAKSRFCLCEPVLIVEQASQRPPSFAPGGTQVNPVSVEIDGVIDAISRPSGIRFFGDLVEIFLRVDGKSSSRGQN